MESTLKHGLSVGLLAAVMGLGGCLSETGHADRSDGEPGVGGSGPADADKDEMPRGSEQTEHNGAGIPIGDMTVLEQESSYNSAVPTMPERGDNQTRGSPVWTPRDPPERR